MPQKYPEVIYENGAPPNCQVVEQTSIVDGGPPRNLMPRNFKGRLGNIHEYTIVILVNMR